MASSRGRRAAGRRRLLIQIPCAVNLRRTSATQNVSLSLSVLLVGADSNTQNRSLSRCVLLVGAGSRNFLGAQVLRTAPMTFFMPLGFNGGYMGIQDHGTDGDPGTRYAVFSVWDQGATGEVRSGGQREVWSSIWNMLDMLI